MKESKEHSGIPVLFCHVPAVGKPFSLDQMREVILHLLDLMVDRKELAINL
jgi:hypothetical protein